MTAERSDLQQAGVQPGESVVIYGGGPAGLMAAYLALLGQASQVMVVDHHPDHLALAERIGAIPIDESLGSAVDQVLARTHGEGAERCYDCRDYQSHDPTLDARPGALLNPDASLGDMVRAVRVTGTIELVSAAGLPLPHDAAVPGELAQRGRRSWLGERPGLDQHFDARDYGWTKVALEPGQTYGTA
ncbi:MAG: glutathione-independent formaldehyde dehydrogenase [Thermoleophilaceae bacterium]|jgi:threonine dehydrogenase-like Zn-dependent dehydrogenase|nr:glutathione-independent formaldehyde dehydrogenase [Thermoleophilaceae bacterium]